VDRIVAGPAENPRLSRWRNVSGFFHEEKRMLEPTTTDIAP
jgi:hypothetical protein